MLNPKKYKEFNELIAKFMNLEKDKETGKWLSPTNGSKMVNLKYQESWDWLVPVIEKLSELVTAEFVVEYQFHFTNSYIISPNQEIIEEIKTDEPTHILMQYAKCYYIIKWINEFRGIKE